MKKTLEVLSILTLFMSLSACDSTPSRDISSPQPLSDEAIESVELQNFSGDFTVQGYSTVETIHESFCEDQDCPTYRYAYFNITSTDNQGLPWTRFGLGCLENNVIRYSNDSDEFGLKEKILSESLTTSIMSSTKTEPISLHLVKLPVTSARIPPTCSSEFTTIEGV